jgi:hypothetical protein
MFVCVCARARVRVCVFVCYERRQAVGTNARVLQPLRWLNVLQRHCGTCSAAAESRCYLCTASTYRAQEEEQISWPTSSRSTCTARRAPPPPIVLNILQNLKRTLQISQHQNSSISSRGTCSARRAAPSPIVTAPPLRACDRASPAWQATPASSTVTRMSSRLAEYPQEARAARVVHLLQVHSAVSARGMNAAPARLSSQELPVGLSRNLLAARASSPPKHIVVSPVVSLVVFHSEQCMRLPSRAATTHVLLKS